jgi:replicative DNA helicase
MNSFPRPDSQPPQNVIQGVAPPHSIEAEQAVLGAVLLSEKPMYQYVVSDNLHPDDFYRERHRLIFESMLALYTENEPIDVLTVTEHLRSRGKLDDAGGQAEIDALTATPPAVGSIRRYAQIVKENSLLRRVLTTTYEIQASVHSHDLPPRDIVERAERAILEVAHDDSTKDFREARHVLDEEVRRWHMLSTEGVTMTGTPSGFADLDEITGGFQPGNLIIVAARPSMGKCLGAATRVADPTSGAQHTIEELVERIESGGEVWVNALGPNWQLRPMQATAAFRNGVKPLFRLTTRNGRTLEATANHPLLTLHGWRRLDELQTGARVAVPATRSRMDPQEQEVVARVAAAASVPGSSLQGPATRLDPPRSTIAIADVWWDEVASIEYVGEDETYDITVPGDHNFVADDIVVHNSALVTNFAENVALHPSHSRAVALFSLEMSESELAQRFVASQASIKGDDLRKGRLKDERKWKRVLETAGRFEHAPLYIDDSSDIGILEIRAKARRLHQQVDGGLGMIIVDYLQLMRADGRTDNRVEQVGAMSRGLKILARELEVPVIALSQLSRGVESRNDKRPLLSDLRESGQIEQDADLVAFIYRDEYYNRETTEALGEAELIIAKHRNGSLGTVELMFQGEYPRFLTKHREAG